MAYLAVAPTNRITCKDEDKDEEKSYYMVASASGQDEVNLPF